MSEKLDYCLGNRNVIDTATWTTRDGGTARCGRSDIHSTHVYPRRLTGSDRQSQTAKKGR